MYTYDEWGNSVLHLQTGAAGIKMFEEMGIKSMPRDEYEKHMESYKKLKQKEDEVFQKFLDDFLEKLKR